MNRDSYFLEDNCSNAKAVLERSRVFAGSPEATADVLGIGEIKTIPKSCKLIKQDERDKDVYLVLEGEFDVEVNGRGVGRRGAGEILGEMAVVDPSSKRSATVSALEDSVVLHIEDRKFCQFADKYPRIWRNIACEIANRLRQRGELVDAKNCEPRLFIGSSGEYLAIANAIQTGLLRSDIIVNVWSQDCFRPSFGTLEALEAEATRCDFALLLFGNEDLVESRGDHASAPRDNVVFELGLFMGKLSSKRVFFAREIGVDIKLPSDLYGIQPIEYRRKNGEALSISVQPICNHLIDVAKKLGTK